MFGVVKKFDMRATVRKRSNLSLRETFLCQLNLQTEGKTFSVRRKFNMQHALNSITLFLGMMNVD